MALDRADASVSVQICRGVPTSRTSQRHSTGCSIRGTCSSTSGRTSATTRSGPRRVSGADGRVVAVEANPENARLIAHTIAVNDADERRARAAGLAAGRGYVNFGTHVGSNGGFLPDDDATTGSGRGTIVPTLALDDLDLDRVVGDQDRRRGRRGHRDRRCGGNHRAAPAEVRDGVLAGDDLTSVGSAPPAAHLQRFVDAGLLDGDHRSGDVRPIPFGSVGELMAGVGRRPPHRGPAARPPAVDTAHLRPRGSGHHGTFPRAQGTGNHRAAVEVVRRGRGRRRGCSSRARRT